MEQVIKLLVSNVEVVIEKELSEFGYAYEARFVIVDLCKGIIGLNILDLFTNNFHDSKSFEDFDEEGDEMPLDFSCQGPSRQV